tara:strand:- start:3289 stop:4002 length:714 start_codon:yes stop_codon:yes gene_type:complete
MKKITTYVITALITLNLSGQSLLPIKYGMKIGANISNFNSTTNDGVENIESSSLIGVSGGFYIEIPLNDLWYINTDLIYSQKGASFNYNYTHNYAVNERDLHKSNQEIRLAYLEINPNVSYKRTDKLSLNIGPSASYLLTPSYRIISDKGEHDGEVAHEELPNSIYEEETLDIGLNIGMSYYLTENFLIESKVNTGFMSIGEVSQEINTLDAASNPIKTNIYNLKNKAITVSIAYLF